MAREPAIVKFCDDRDGVVVVVEAISERHYKLLRGTQVLRDSITQFKGNHVRFTDDYLEKLQSEPDSSQTLLSKDVSQRVPRNLAPLPQELLYEIMTYLANDYFTLHKCILASHALAYSAIQFMYRDPFSLVSDRRRAKLIWLLVQYLTDEERTTAMYCDRLVIQGSRPCLPYANFIQVLDDVKIFDACGAFYANRKRPYVPRQLILRLMAVCTKLKELSLVNVCWIKRFDVFGKVGPQLTFFRFGSVDVKQATSDTLRKVQIAICLCLTQQTQLQRLTIELVKGAMSSFLATIIELIKASGKPNVITFRACVFERSSIVLLRRLVEQLEAVQFSKCAGITEDILTYLRQNMYTLGHLSAKRQDDAFYITCSCAKNANFKFPRKKRRR
ncbi:10088_t:CDS:2 [Paraglomus occultum]|uniref:10088_t:CDS:1 n=1 Tax=Paraglomus occultum TaxID=144539 RepID=A0A9N8VHQ0_9GLOM|nr:10088_t:CDS:2 [Paraglomus occultum]